MNIKNLKKYILWDTEFTTWQGCHENGWNAKNMQYKEFIQIAMLKVENNKIIDKFVCFVKPKINPKLSDYCINLTGISQEDVKNAEMFKDIIPKMIEFVEDCQVFAYGDDAKVLLENCVIAKVANPFNVKQFHNIRPFFKSAGVPIEKYSSGTLIDYYNIKLKHMNDVKVHDAYYDVLSLFSALQEALNISSNNHSKNTP